MVRVRRLRGCWTSFRSPALMNSIDDSKPMFLSYHIVKKFSYRSGLKSLNRNNLKWQCIPHVLEPPTQIQYSLVDKLLILELGACLNLYPQQFLYCQVHSAAINGSWCVAERQLCAVNGRGISKVFPCQW